MSYCSCRGGRVCNYCRGVKLNQFKPTDIITSAKEFVLVGNEKLPYQTLLNSIQASIIQPPINRVQAVSPTYTHTGIEDVVWCTGDIVVTLALTSECKRITNFNSNGGTVSFVAQAGETHSITDVTSGSSAPIAGNEDTKEWREL